MATVIRATPEQLAKARQTYGPQQQQFAAQYNPSGVNLPGPGFFVGPYYFTDDGQRYVAPGTPGGQGRFVPVPLLGDFHSGTLQPGPFQVPGGVNPRSGPMLDFGTRSPWTSNQNPNHLPPSVSGPDRSRQPMANTGQNSSSNWLQQLIPTLAASIPTIIAATRGGGGGGGNSGTAGMDPTMAALIPQMTALFEHQMSRQRALDPLFADVVGMTHSRLPTWARGAGGPLASTPNGEGAGPAAEGNANAQAWRQQVQDVRNDPTTGSAFTRDFWTRMRNTMPSRQAQGGGTPQAATGPVSAPDIGTLLQQILPALSMLPGQRG